MLKKMLRRQERFLNERESTEAVHRLPAPITDTAAHSDTVSGSHDTGPRNTWGANNWGYDVW